jgi:hypothetical protein
MRFKRGLWLILAALSITELYAQAGTGFFIDGGIGVQLFTVGYNSTADSISLPMGMVPKIQVGYNFTDYIGLSAGIDADGYFLSPMGNKAGVKMGTGLLRIGFTLYFNPHIIIGDTMSVDLGLGPHVAWLKGSYSADDSDGVNHSGKISALSIGPGLFAGFTYKSDSGFYCGVRIGGNWDMVTVDLGSTNSQSGDKYRPEEGFFASLYAGFWVGGG